jgi:hypothetical protein
LVKEISRHYDAMRTFTPCRDWHGVKVSSNGQLGLMRVILDPLIAREAISPCWLKLTA